MNTIYWDDGAPVALDQTKLPLSEEYVRMESVEAVAEAIERLVVRGAPLIGVSAAYGMALSARVNRCRADYLEKVRRDRARLQTTRPTAVNLFWALDRALAEIERAYSAGGADAAATAALALAERMKMEDVEINRRMGAFGEKLIADGDGILTHCNAGALATAGHGTALGVIRSAVSNGKCVHVYADETRPLLQGARLSSFELMADGVDTTVICDNMASQVMKNGWVQAVFVGCDRVAANGDACNKIGTSGVAILAKYYGIPFYVCGPTSTIDMSVARGEDIPIEQRPAHEVTEMWYKKRMAPEGVNVYNPAFDFADSELITAIITEYGIARPPYNESLKEIFLKKQEAQKK